VAALTVKDIQQRDARWCVVDPVGKRGCARARGWPRVRVVKRGGEVQSTALNEKVVWQLLPKYAAAAGVSGIAPHDLRRTCAKLCRAAGGELEQIQLLLGHASVQTTERYLRTKQDLVHEPNDGIKLQV
jgi:integrase